MYTLKGCILCYASDISMKIQKNKIKTEVTKSSQMVFFSRYIHSLCFIPPPAFYCKKLQMRSKVKSEFLVPPTHIRQLLTWCHICFSVPAHTRVVWFFFLRRVAFACVAHTTTVSSLRVNNLFCVPQPSTNSRWRNVSCVSGAVPSSSLQATEPFL